MHHSLSFLACVISLVHVVIHGEETVEIEGYIYADNYFELYFNGEFIANDSIGWIPHNAERVNFSAPVTGTRTFAILAKDYSNEVTALEYDNNCIGDGGLRAIFSDGTVTNSNWKCSTIFYGPIDEGECFGDCFGKSCGVDPARFIIGQCKDGELGGNGSSCIGEHYSYDSNWYAIDYDDSNWDDATEYDEDTVGWGQSPSNYYDDIYNTSVIDPLWINWTSSSFIWQSSLNFDNTILCRYSYQVINNTAVIDDTDDSGDGNGGSGGNGGNGGSGGNGNSGDSSGSSGETDNDSGVSVTKLFNGFYFALLAIVLQMPF